MTDTVTVSLSLSEAHRKFLDTNPNRSEVVRKLIDPLISKRVTLDFIKSQLETIDYSKIIEYGIEQLADEARRRKDLVNFNEMKQQKPKRKSLMLVIRDAMSNPDITDCKTLLDYIEEAGYERPTFSNPFNIINQGYRIEADWLRHQTNDKYTFNYGGKIVEA